jgi:hypothetical protein
MTPRWSLGAALVTLGLSTLPARGVAQSCDGAPEGECIGSAAPVSAAPASEGLLSPTDADALRAVIDAYAASGALAGSPAAEDAARAAFLLAEPSGEAFESFALDTHARQTADDYVHSIIEQIHMAGTRGSAAARAYDPVLDYQRPHWSIAAYVRQGRTYEHLTRAIADAQHPLPGGMIVQIGRASPDVQAQIAREFNDRIRRALLEELEPVDCLAMIAYLRAVRVQEASLLDTERGAYALDRLAAYGVDRVQRCAREQRTREYAFVLPNPSALTRPPRGLLAPSAPWTLRLGAGSRALLAQMDTGDATVELVTAAVGAAPHDAILRALVAVRLTRTGHASEALAMLDHGAPPEELAMYLARGETLRALGRADDAVMLGLAATSRFPTDGAARLELSLAYSARAALRTGQERLHALEAALVALTTSMSLRPERPEDDPSQRYLDTLMTELERARATP